jgi:hypothetical protein
MRGRSNGDRWTALLGGQGAKYEARRPQRESRQPGEVVFGAHCMRRRGREGVTLAWFVACGVPRVMDLHAFSSPLPPPRNPSHIHRTPTPSLRSPSFDLS